MGFIVSILGTRWLERELTAKPGTGYLLLSGDDDDVLAWELHVAQRIDGFNHLVKALQARTSYETVAELRAMNHLVRAGQGAWFIDPNAKDGPAYDAGVLLSGLSVAVEVKAKESKPIDEFRPSLIENPLRKARRQLPSRVPAWSICKSLHRGLTTRRC